MTLLEYALDAHRRGWHVFPCQPRTKDQPATAHGCADATRDVEQIKRWWSKNPNYNPAVTGGVIVDCDSGLTSLDDVCRWMKLVGLPETLIVRTGRRSSYGAQLHFTGHATNRRYENVNGVAGEIRCKNQYGMAPGAIHPETGERYEIVVDLPLAPWNENCDFAKRSYAKQKLFLPWKNNVKKQRSRHPYLVPRATALFHQGLFGKALVAAVSFLNETYCDPPKPQRKIDEICRWVEEHVIPGISSDDEDTVSRLTSTDPEFEKAWNGKTGDDQAALEYLVARIRAAGITTEDKVVAIVQRSPLSEKLDAAPVPDFLRSEQ